ncbi:Activating signal cointegrator 1 complex subunit-like protein [Emericellopsis cladophorae]|uniref:Activating signal cointegrator 1 complex subunit-like protein n=1 Tax=Emericellopsis cladophorae TaxID=2686198 RepID=A0A9P9Y0Z3_9HYPO|nr:Activating signal cointegrator 1 complex subunit-like protein [Emericellopsis cladophorae]KAI6781539.1 Activating signal cointegrator 1 complex subunit-like protein [Emericellopsis cladophorae]
MIATRINLRPLQKRSFSIISTLRNAGRAMEAHPFERLSSSKAKAPADWGRQIRRIAGQSAVFFPFYAVMMGWPLAIAWVSESRIGYLTRSLASFKADITAPHSSAVPESAVRPPGTLHLTLGVMTLKDEVLHQAVSTLRGLSLKAVLEEARAPTATEAAVVLGSPNPSLDQNLQVTLKGIQPLQPPAQCRVIYAPPVDPSGLLRRFGEMGAKAVEGSDGDMVYEVEAEVRFED